MKKNNDEAIEKAKQADALYPEIKVFVNLFYEIQSISGYIVPNVENGLKKISPRFRFQDKQRFNRIIEHLDAIRRLNEEMIEPFWQSLPSGTYDLMRRDANDITRIILLVIDRVGYDSNKFAQLENWIAAMPSSGFVSDDIVNLFRLR